MADISQRQVLNLFQVIGAISNSDMVLLHSAAGNSAVKITAELFRAYLNQDFTVSIDENGYWTIGGSSTGVKAAPMLRNNGGNLEVSNDLGETWETIIPVDDLMPVLTPEQIASLKLTFSDLTEEDIAVLQQPLRQAAENVVGITPAGNYDETVNYWFLARVYDPLTNCSYISRQKDNLGHSVLDQLWWQKDTAGGVILGPFTREQYDAMVASGQVSDNFFYAIAEE